MSSRHTVPVAALALLLAAGCEAPAPTVAAEPGWAEPDADADADSDPDQDTGSEVDTGVDSETGSETDTGIDCGELPGEPAGIDGIGWEPTAPGASMAFAPDGSLVTAVGHSLYAGKRGETATLWVAAAGCARGLAALPTGDVVCGGTDALFLFDGITGTRRTALVGLREPSAVAVGPKGEVYVAERLGGSVLEVNPYTSAAHPVAAGVTSPNAVAVDGESGVLYVNGECDALYRVRPDGVDAQPERLFSPQQPPAGGDCVAGLAVDACGNLLVLVAEEPRVLRVDPEEHGIEEFAVLGDFAEEAYDFEWGPGDGGFAADALYVLGADDVLVELLTGAGSSRSTPSR